MIDWFPISAPPSNGFEWPDTLLNRLLCWVFGGPSSNGRTADFGSLTRHDEPRQVIAVPDVPVPHEHTPQGSKRLRKAEPPPSFSPRGSW